MKRIMVVAGFVLLAACGDIAEEESVPAGPPMEVTAQELFNAYQANEAAAQQQYGGRLLMVSGTVAGIELDFMDDPVVQLLTSNEFMNAQAALSDASKPQAASLSKGQQIKVLCKGVSEVVGVPMLSDCDIQ